eukprot:scaffold27874_cov67-Phaeocystis_antarctica.AAC.1
MQPLSHRAGGFRGKARAGRAGVQATRHAVSGVAGIMYVTAGGVPALVRAAAWRDRSAVRWPGVRGDGSLKLGPASGVNC